MKPFCGLAYVELLQFKEIRNRLILSRKIIIMVVACGFCGFCDYCCLGDSLGRVAQFFSPCQGSSLPTASHPALTDSEQNISCCASVKVPPLPNIKLALKK